MLKVIKNLLLLAFCANLLTACSSNTKEVLGIKRQAPDEFKVVSHPPLSLPPEFSLRPPVNEKAIASINDNKGAVVFERVSMNVSSVDINTSLGESAFLDKFGAQQGNPSIKTILKVEESRAEKETGLLEKFALFSTKEADEASVVNAMDEKERLAKNKQEGKAANEGETPTVKQKEGGILNNIFGF